MSVAGRDVCAGDLSLGDRVSRGGPVAVEDGISILGDLLDQLAELHRFERPHGAIGEGTVFVSVGPAGPTTTLGLPDRSGRTRLAGYLAPELLAGEGPSREADLWAMGALAHWMFAGRRPEPGSDGEIESLALIAAAVPLRLGGIVGRMLSPDPSLRPSAADAAAAVRHLREQLCSPRAVPPPPAPSGRAGGWLSRLLRPRAPAPSPARAPPPPSSLALLCLQDFDPGPRTPQPPAPPEDRLEAVLAATLAEGLGLEDLPAFPSVALEVIELTRQEEVGANELVRLIHRDPSLTARVLRMANSAYASRGSEVTSVRDAVTRLGLREVGGVAATAATRSLFEPIRYANSQLLSDAARLHWIHAMASASSASWLAMESGGDAQRAFLGGMLHDIGKTLALRAFARLVSTGRVRGVEAASLLPPVLEATHGELGLWLAKSWALPEFVDRACADHHAPRVGPQEDRELFLVRVVSGLASLRLDPGWTARTVAETQESATLLGFDRFRIRALAQEVRALADRARALAAAEE